MKRGKKPKEREKYILRAQNGELIEVTREVYLEWYQSRRREKYQRERDQKYGVCSLNVLEETGMLSAVSVPAKGGLEELVFQKIQRSELMKALKKLPEQDVYLIYLLYYKELTVKATAEFYQCSRKSVQDRRKRILTELYQIMQSKGTEAGADGS